MCIRDSVYTATCTASSDGTPSVSVVAGKFTDGSSNDNTASNTYTWTYDGTAPTVAITSTASNPATGSTFAVVITFSETTTNFVVGDITVGGGTASLSGSGTTYTATITPSADGTVTVDVAAGVATDAVGNANTAATQFSIESDQPNAPSFASNAVTTATEDSAYSYTVQTSDADDGSPNSNTVTVTCTTCPSWLSYSSSTGKLTGTPADLSLIHI